MSDRLSIALVQQDTVWHDPSANLSAAAEWVARAAAQGARVVVFPELFATGFTMQPEPFAEAIPGPTSQALSTLAQRHGVWIIGTVVEAAAPRPRNAAFALRPDGSLACTYRKIHPFSYGDENLHYQSGSEGPLFDLDGVPAGLAICYDLRFPELFRSMATRGAELVFVLANWPSRRARHWSTLLAARAIENQMAVCGVNRAGRDPQLEYPGLSVLLDARGEPVAQGDAQPGLFMGTLDLADLRAWRGQFPALRDRRPDIYAQLV